MFCIITRIAFTYQAANGQAGSAQAYWVRFGGHMTQWTLDERLAGDTIHVGSFSICDLRLMDDARWPWLILVPRIPDAVELHELYTDQRQDIDMEVAFVAGVLKELATCEKINIAAIGNIVRQLHIHIIGRNKGDANWPGPVWGHGSRKPYDNGHAEQFAVTLRERLELEPS